ncbi:MerR family transcriptional regulator [Gordonia neofelifaecis]|uniref:Transcriptional regulator n=1 Tax=Gordonia neofelifaecis NRRL B-59395 TaxID=644548 RepID=F1YEF3_9ACTN|nr:MerR family transcriptional regulator [Gordonia neofelifaecis]EGD56786.1 transcriptional regulator [Gordonia neofelifaecis NRRL B-59395]
MRIGEVARRSGVSARMLRHYDALGLVTPSGRTSTGYRDYTATDVARIFHVESLRSLGLSLREVGQALDDPEFAPAELIAELKERSEVRIEREQELLARLEHIEDAGSEDWDQVLGAVAILAGLGSAKSDRRQRAALNVADGTAPVEALVESLLDEADPNVAGALRWAIVRTGTAAVASLAAAAADDDVERRRRAVFALIDLPGPESDAALAGLLRDDDLQVRSRAALELAARGDRSTVEVLIGLVVAGERDVDAADALALLAAETGTEDDVAQGLSAVAAEAPVAVRCRVAQALGEVGGRTAASALADLAGDDDEMVSRTAAYLLSVRSP